MSTPLRIRAPHLFQKVGFFFFFFKISIQFFFNFNHLKSMASFLTQPHPLKPITISCLLSLLALPSARSSGHFLLLLAHPTGQPVTLQVSASFSKLIVHTLLVPLLFHQAQPLLLSRSVSLPPSPTYHNVH